MKLYWLESAAHVATAFGVIVASVAYSGQVRGQRIDRSLDLYYMYYSADLDKDVADLVDAYFGEVSIVYSPETLENRRESLISLINNRPDVRSSLKSIDSFLFAAKNCVSGDRCDVIMSSQLFIDPANEVYCRYFPAFEDFEARYGLSGFGESIEFFSTRQWPCLREPLG